MVKSLRDIAMAKTVIVGVGMTGLYLIDDSVAAPGSGDDVGNESVLIAFNKITGKEI